MANPILLYSTNTYLAFLINETYYKNKHYVWCNEYFDSRTLPSHLPPLPPSSCPGELYRQIRMDITGKDLHSARIAANKTGLLNGAAAKKAAGIINAQQEQEIASIIQAATIDDYKPLLYVIPFNNSINKIAKPVNLTKRASHFHQEFIIEQLNRDKFGIIEL